MSKSFYNLEKIPKNWKVSRLKYILSFSEEKSKNILNENYLSLSKRGIILKDISLNEGQIAEDYSDYILTKKGQISMNPMDLLTGWVDISNFDGLISPAYYTFNVNKNFDTSFINYFLQSNYYRKTFFKLGKGVASHDNYGRWVITPDELKNIYIFFPNLNEQKVISQYLNMKTSQLDKLVEKTQNKINLLEIKKKVLIDQCVNKGLNSKIELRDSGIKWIGKVPKHWRVGSFKYYIDVLTDYTANGSFKSLAENVEYLSQGFSRLVRLTDLRQDLQNDGIYVSEKSHNFLKKSELFGDEILIANVGAYTGFALKMPINKGVCTLGPNMYLIRNNKHNSNLDYLVYLLNAKSTQQGLDLLISSTAQPKINKDNLKSLNVPFPPKSEQDDIAKFLNKKLKLVDNLILKEKSIIKKFIEYRKSIISLAVIGDISVSNRMI
jgi:type I restriction enzyme S subunit